MTFTRTLLTALLLATATLAQQSQVVFNAAPAQPPMISVTQAGQTGSTTYCYWVVAIYTGGNSGPNGPICVNTANATLSSTNYNIVTFAPPSALATPTGYDILRTTSATAPTGACACVVAANQSASPVNDQSNTTSAYSVVTASTSSALYLDNSTAATPNLTLKTGAVTYPLVDNTGAFVTATNATTGASGVVYSVDGSVTVAQINAGIIIVPAVTGRTLKIVGFVMQAIGGAAATCTAIQVDDTTGTPVVGVSANIAQLTQNTIVTEATASVVLTTFLLPLTASQGLQIIKTGSSCATMTSMNYRVFYKINR